MTVRGKNRTPSADNLSARSMTTQQLLESSYQKVLNKYYGFLNEETEKEKKERERLQAIQRGIYGQESGYGKAKTDKPNYAGAMGPMQITPGTFKWMKDSKIIPQDYDIKNPEHNKAAGNALIGHYYQKYQGDPAKVAAAYYAGPGAINKDGTINTHWRDRKNPKAPNVGQYIDSALGKSGIKDVTYTAAKPSAVVATTTTTPTPVKPRADVAAVTTPTSTITMPNKPPTADVVATSTIPPAKPGPDVATTSSTVPGADMIAAVDRPIVPKDTKLLPSPPPGVNFKDVFDMPAYLKATDREDMTKFIKSTPAGQAYKKSLSERYELFKKQNNNQLN